MMTSRNFSRIAVCSVFLAVLCAPLTARACDTTRTADVASTCVTMARVGVQGVWFDRPTADGLRRLKLEVPELKLQIVKLENLEKKSDKEIGLLRESLELRKDVIKGLKASIGGHVRAARVARQEATQARAELDRWYRSPLILMGVGVVMTLSIGALGVVLVNK